MNRPLIIGTDGALGAALWHKLLPSCQVVGTTRRLALVSSNRPYLDLSGNVGLFAWPRQGVDVMYLVAAVTKVVDCEATPAPTWRVNADAPVELARRAVQNGAHPIFISSDAVERAPSLNYSRQKAYVESLVLALGGAVVRPSRITPEGLPDLVKLLVDLGNSLSEGLHRWTP